MLIVLNAFNTFGGGLICQFSKKSAPGFCCLRSWRLLDVQGWLSRADQATPAMKHPRQKRDSF
jgi:hypothetical protein